MRYFDCYLHVKIWFYWNFIIICWLVVCIIYKDICLKRPIKLIIKQTSEGKLQPIHKTFVSPSAIERVAYHLARELDPTKLWFLQFYNFRTIDIKSLWWKIKILIVQSLMVYNKWRNEVVIAVYDRQGWHRIYFSKITASNSMKLFQFDTISTSNSENK